MATVVRDLEQELGERFRSDHLPARRDDQPLELAEEPARVAVGGDDDGLRAGLLERRDTRVLADLDSSARGAGGESPDEPCRLENAVRRMEDGGRIPHMPGVDPVPPLDREAVGS